MNKYIWLFLFLVVSCLTGCGLSENVIIAEQDTYGTPETGKTGTETLEADAEGISQSTDEKGNVHKKSQDVIYIYVCGHVEEPGVYQLPVDARICDALQMAGGVTKDGNPEALNQAECMTDGQTLYVPGVDETVENVAQQSSEEFKININQANRDELMTLSGIGEAKADMIIQYREEHGDFQSVEELMDIPGIKEGVYNKMKDKITCR